MLVHVNLPVQNKDKCVEIIQHCPEGTVWYTDCTEEERSMLDSLLDSLLLLLWPFKSLAVKYTVLVLSFCKAISSIQAFLINTRHGKNVLVLLTMSGKGKLFSVSIAAYVK